MWFGDQEHDDQSAHDDQLQMRHKVSRPTQQINADELQGHRQNHKERRPRETAKDAPQPTDDDHEEHKEGLLNSKDLPYFHGA